MVSKQAQLFDEHLFVHIVVANESYLPIRAGTPFLSHIDLVKILSPMYKFGVPSSPIRHFKGMKGPILIFSAPKF